MRAGLQVVANAGEQPRFVQEGQERVQQGPGSYAAEPQPETFMENEAVYMTLDGFSLKPEPS